MTGLSPLPLGRFGPLQRGGSGAGPQPRRIALAVLAGLGALLLVVAGTAGSLLLFAVLAAVVTLATAAPGVALVAHFTGFLVGLLAGRARLLHPPSADRRPAAD